MDRILHKQQNKIRRKNRIRSKINGTNKRPRLSVHISNLHVSAQLVDDATDHTIISVNSYKTKDGNLTDKAVIVGTEIAKLAKTKKIKQVVLDRNGKLYHGRVKAFAEAARKEGLEF